MDSIIQQDDGEMSFRIVLVTPLMRRCHKLRSAGVMVSNRAYELTCVDYNEQVFIDSCTDFIAHENIFVGIIMCGTPGGAVPLGMYITNDMTVPSMALVFDALKTILGEEAFNNCGVRGPQSAMADEGIEIKGFIEVYPESQRRRCCFHIFQNGN